MSNRDDSGKFTSEPSHEEVADLFAQHLGIRPSRVPRSREEASLMLLAGLTGQDYSAVDAELEARGYAPPVKPKTDLELMRESNEALRAEVAKLAKQLTHKTTASQELADARADIENIKKDYNQ